MEDVVWYRKPLLSEPVAILAFEGWSDAGNTATGCVENLSSCLLYTSDAADDC